MYALVGMCQVFAVLRDVSVSLVSYDVYVFFFNDTATTEIYTE